MIKVKAGDTIQNERGWQGRVLQVTKTKRFGTSYLVQYASTRKWEDSVYLVAEGIETDCPDCDGTTGYDTPPCLACCGTGKVWA